MPDNEDFVNAQEPLQIPHASAVNSVFAKMPFPQLHSITNIEMFFTKLESWFLLEGLGARKEQEKYAAVIAYADPKYLDQVHDQPSSKQFCQNLPNQRWCASTDLRQEFN